MLLSSIDKFLLFATAFTTIATPLVVSQVTQAQSDSEAITITFDAKVGDEQFACGASYTRLGTSETSVTLTDFRFYVSDVALIDENGNAVPVELEQDNKWQYQNVALLDFEDKTGACGNGTVETRNIVVGTIPPGNYQGLKFTLGVPSQLNHEDAAIAPSPLNLTSLWWSWQFGYKFLRADLQNETAAMNNKQMKHNDMSHGSSSSQTFPIHLGSTGCQETATTYECNNPNRSDITLENFIPDNSVVVADLANLLALTDVTNNQPDTPAGCMSSPEDMDCMGIAHNLGLSFDNKASAGQTFFYVE